MTDILWFLFVTTLVTVVIAFDKLDRKRRRIAERHVREIEKEYIEQLLNEKRTKNDCRDKEDAHG